MGCTHSLYKLLKSFEGQEEVCKEHRKNLIGEAAHESLPILFPFVIEYALIGATVALIMSYHIGR